MSAEPWYHPDAQPELEAWAAEEGVVLVLDAMASDMTRAEWARRLGMRVDALERLRTQYGWHFKRAESARPEET